MGEFGLSLKLLLFLKYLSSCIHWILILFFLEQAVYLPFSLIFQTVLWVQFLPFLPALHQELFPFVSIFILSLSIVFTLYSSPPQIHSVPLSLYKSFHFASLELLPILLFFTSSQWVYTFISFTSYLLLLIHLQSCFCALSRARCDLLVGNQWSFLRFPYLSFF